MRTIELESPTLRLAIAPDLGGSIVGFWLRRSDAGPWTPVMRATPDATSSSDTACFLMAPWTNRIAGASFEFEGRTLHVIANRPEGSSIHGVFRDHPFRALDRSPVSARLACDLGASPAWGFACALEATYRLIESELRVDLRLTNTSPDRMPAGLGLHPYFHRRLWGESSAQSAQIRVTLAGRYPAQDCLPTGASRVDAITRQLDAGVATDEISPLDDVFDGWADAAEIVWPASGVSMRVDPSPELGHAVIFAPPNDHTPLGDLFCVEPCTTVNNAFNLAAQGWEDTGMVALEPGAALEGRCSFTIHGV